MTDRDHLRRFLRLAAIEAFKAGRAWEDFWRGRRAQVARVERPGTPGFDRLQAELLHLVVSGERSGQFGVGDPDALDPWRADDARPTKPHDTTTRARIQLPLFDFYAQTRCEEMSDG